MGEFCDAVKEPSKIEADIPSSALPAEVDPDIAEARTALAENPTRLRNVTLENGTLSLDGGPEAHARMAVAFGSNDREFQTYCLGQLIQILPDGKDYTLPVNAALEMLSAIGPTNAMEAMLAVQMLASHHLSMIASARAKRATEIPQYEANGNMANKFARTHAAQVEALSRLRRKGEQVVRHVHVNEGGQAVIAGTVHTGGRNG